MKAIALYRVSTDHQDHARQVKSIKEYSISNRIEIIHTYTEIDVSGFKTELKDRFELLKILDRAEHTKDFDVLLVDTQDRLSRRSEDLPKILYLLSRFNIKIIQTENGEEIKNDTHIDKLMNYINGWLAEYESIKISVRVKGAFSVYNEQGRFLGGVPFGYMLENTNMVTKKGRIIKKLIPNPKEIEIVKLIFDLYVNNSYGLTLVANYLNEHKYSNRKGSLWTPTVISGIIHNSTYIGYKPYGKDTITRDGRIRNKEHKTQPYNPDLHIIDIEVFNKGQELAKARLKRKGKNVNTSTIAEQGLLSGLVYCKCGAKMKTGYSLSKYFRQSDNTDVRLKVYYYTCPNLRINKEEHSKIASKTTHSVIKHDKAIEELVLNFINSFDENKFRKKLYERKSHKKDNEIEKLNRLNKEKGNLLKLIEQYSVLIDKCVLENDELKMNIYIGNIERNNQTLKQLDNEINELKEMAERKQQQEEAYSDVIKKIDGFEEKWNKANLNQKRSLISLLIDKIILSDDGRKVISDYF